MDICEPCQGGNTAALSRTVDVPQGCLAELIHRYRIEVSSQVKIYGFSLMEVYMGCMLCPRECNADRASNQKGYCGETNEIKIARAALHMWEEPCICAGNGSGAVFFSGCPLQCIFCQNADIATGACGKVIAPGRLTEIFLELQEKGACNINLITPTHFIHQIIPALRQAKYEGLSIPVVYNTGGYEKADTLRLIEGLVDIYLPDFKYVSSRLSARYSNAPDYFETACTAIAEMFRQVGPPVMDSKTGLMKKGLIVRHLMMPRHLADSKRVIAYLFETYRHNIYISIMNQYTPMHVFADMPELSRRVSRKEYHALADYCISLGVENGYFQEGDTASESFIPPFDYTGV